MSIRVAVESAHPGGQHTRSRHIRTSRDLKGLGKVLEAEHKKYKFVMRRPSSPTPNPHRVLSRKLLGESTGHHILAPPPPLHCPLLSLVGSIFIGRWKARFAESQLTPLDLHQPRQCTSSAQHLATTADRPDAM